LANGPIVPSSNSSLLGELTLSDYLQIARRRRWFIILSSIGLLVAAGVTAYRLPNVYKAETTILVDSQQVPDKYVPAIVTGDIAGRLSTLQQQVLSPTRLKKLVENEGLYPDSSGKTEEAVIRGVSKGITVAATDPGGGKLSAFKITYSSRNRAEVAQITNHLAQMFIGENEKVRVDMTQDTAQFLEDQLKDKKRQLDETDAQLRSIKSHNIEDLPESKPYHMEALATLRGQVQAIQDKISQDQRDKSILESMLDNGGPAPTLDVDSGQSGVAGVSSNEAQLHKLEAKLAELRGKYGPAHPDVRRTQQEIDRLKKQIADEPHDAQGVVADQKPAIQPDRTQHKNPVVQAQIEKLDEEIKEQTKLLPPLQERMEFHTSKLAQEPVFEQQIARLQQDYDSLKTQYSALLDKKQGAEMSYALEVHQKGERFVVLDAAQTPTAPAAPNRLLITIAGLFGGLMLGAALAAIAEMNDESVRTESEAVRIFGKPILGGIPRIISGNERVANMWRAAGLILGTVAGSIVLGLLVAFVSKGLL
jgi:succinoglycan biosynthesis transport protein ExoP